LTVGLSAANTHDSLVLEPMVDAVPPVKGPRGRPGRPRKRPAKLLGDKGYDNPRCRRRTDLLIRFLHLVCALICLSRLDRPKRGNALLRC
jgi:hypothetical protein